MMSETGGRQDWAELSDETLTADSTVTPTGDPAPCAIILLGLEFENEIEIHSLLVIKYNNEAE